MEVGSKCAWVNKGCGTTTGTGGYDSPANDMESVDRRSLSMQSGINPGTDAYSTSVLLLRIPGSKGIVV